MSILTSQLNTILQKLQSVIQLNYNTGFVFLIWLFNQWSAVMCPDKLFVFCEPKRKPKKEIQN